MKLKLDCFARTCFIQKLTGCFASSGLGQLCQTDFPLTNEKSKTKSDNTRISLLLRDL
uniref:Uncharacterized protein n=1 Tax=Pundamilia nyererei TaxID=303518 RepID=A0A3B4G6V9_9CICH